VLDSNAERLRLLRNGRVTYSLYYWSTRIYEVDGAAERHIPVTCTESWGTCELEDEPGGVPIPAGAVGAPEDDGHMVVWDIVGGIAYEFWRYRHPDGAAAEGQTSWGGLVSTTGNGVDDPSGRLGAGGATGADISLLAGTIRVFEVEAGVIPHALVGSTTNSCNSFRWPALKSDGWSDRPDCLPEGARIQLDPSIDLDTVTGMRPIDRMVAEALQTYGWYNRDNGGSFDGTATSWSIMFEVDPTATGDSCGSGNPLGDAYCDAGVSGEYDALRGTLPDGSALTDHLRVLQSWDGR
jgi:hypothetical protein